MKRTIRILAYAAILGSAILSGCNKEGFESRRGEAVHFSAVSGGGPTTKTSYGDDVDGYQMINWKANDYIRVWSDNATHRYGDNQHWADYYTTGSTAEGHKSTASLAAEQLYNTDYDNPQGSANGLVWGDAETCQFWGIYPSTKTNSNITIDANGAVVASLPTNNTLNAGSSKTQNSIAYKVCPPDMNYAYMTAYEKVTGAPAKVNLEFQPAFTAIEINLSSSDEDFTVSGVSLQGNEWLSGKYTMTAGSLESVTVTDGDAAFKTVSYTGGNVAITQTSGLTVTFFTIPKDNVGAIALIVNTDQGDAKLKFTKKGSLDPYTFEAGHKYRINLLKMGGRWQILFGDDGLTVEQWDDTATGSEGSTGLIIE